MPTKVPEDITCNLCPIPKFVITSSTITVVEVVVAPFTVYCSWAFIPFALVVCITVSGTAAVVVVTISSIATLKSLILNLVLL